MDLLFKNRIMEKGVILLLFPLFILRISLFIDNNLFNIFFGIFSNLFLVLYIFSIKRLKRNQVDYILLCILIATISISVSFFNGFGLFKSIYDLNRYLLIISLYGIGLFTAKHFKLTNIKQLFFLVLIFHLLIAIYQLLTGNILEISGDKRLNGYFENTGQFGTFLGYAFIVLFILINSAKKKLFYYFLLILTVIILALNNTARVFATIFLSFIFYFLTEQRNLKYLLALVVLSLIVIYFNDQVYDRISNMLTANYNLNEIYGEQLDNSFQWRVLHWYQLISDWWNNYTFFGAGLGHETMLSGYKTSDGRTFIAHSDFIKFLIELGMIPFMLLVLVLIYLLNKIFIWLKAHNLNLVKILIYYCFANFILGGIIFTISFYISMVLLGIIQYLKMSNSTYSESNVTM
ncbi:O-antigen ligase family protein [Marivirga sp. S37H4]|uniref:O-antigen ligase family protein n=1 Tax=Marivirga aurantiaca TaxID=2802615 RepID=A0A934X1Q0_9BACT|nr:O-antigen ligase family protein [Marivirga aurantiaca]MBK6267064.1 O-antigen ligase family protein [Marivirga aurantiaca]